MKRYIYACRCFEAIARARVLVLGDKWCRLATPKNTSLQVNVPGDGTEHSRSKVREHTTCPKASSMTIACARIAFRRPGAPALAFNGVGLVRAGVQHRHPTLTCLRFIAPLYHWSSPLLTSNTSFDNKDLLRRTAPG